MADAILCYGVVCANTEDLPWVSEEYEGDIEAWWRDVNNWVPPEPIYVNSPEYTGTSQLIHGLTQKDVDAHHDYIQAWDEANPMPVDIRELDAHGDGVWVISVPKAFALASAGETQRLEMGVLRENAKDGQQVVQKFIRDHKIEVESPIGWVMSAEM